MAHVKTITVKAIYETFRGAYWQTRSFTTFTDDDGNNYYFVSGEQVSKDEGNKTFLDIKKANREWTKSQDCKDFIKRQWASYYKAKKSGWKETEFTLHETDTFKQETTEYDISYEEILKRLYNSIDNYVQYIDDYKQYKAAVESNKRIYEKIRALEKLMEKKAS